MNGGDPLLIVGTLLAAVAILSIALLKAWEGWLGLRRLELGQGDARPLPSAARRRLELIDLRDRVRRLEAIADGTED